MAISGVYISKINSPVDPTARGQGGVTFRTVEGGVKVDCHVFINENGSLRDVTHIGRVWFKLFGARSEHVKNGKSGQWEQIGSATSKVPPEGRTGTPTSSGGEGFVYSNTWTSFPSGITVVKCQVTVQSSDPSNVDWWWPDATAYSDVWCATPEELEHQAQLYADPNTPTSASATRDGDGAVVTCSITESLATNNLRIERQLDSSSAGWTQIASMTPAASVRYEDRANLRGHKARYRFITENTRNRKQSPDMGAYTDWVEFRPSQIVNTLEVSCADVSGETGSVYLKWYPIGETGQNVIIQYHDGAGFDSGDVQTVTVERGAGEPIPDHYTITNLDAAKRWYFRVRVDSGEIGNSGWTNVMSCIIAATPSTPTVSQLMKSYTLGDTITFAWQHASPDGAAQQAYEITYTKNGTATTLTGGSDQQRTITLEGYGNGQVGKLKVRTRTFPDKWSPWSSEPTFTVYTAPNSDVELFAGDGSSVDESNPLTSLPLHVYVGDTSYPTGNSPIWWRVTVRAVNAYATVGPDGNAVNIAAGQALVDWSISNGDTGFPTGRLHISIGSAAMTFEPGQEYEVTAECTTEAGLKSQSTPQSFLTQFTGGMVVPSAQLEWFEDAMRVDIRPTCVWYDETEDEPVYRENTALSVYRVSQDGSTHLVAEGLPNGGTTCSDPHADFGKSVYRIIATDTTNGMMAATDREIETPIEDCCILWNETEKTYDTEGNPAPYMGRAVIGRFGMEFSEEYGRDTSLSEHAGADFPVPHFGDMREHKVDINLASVLDDGTDESVRELAGMKGTCYMRFPGIPGFKAVLNSAKLGGKSTIARTISVGFTRVKEDGPEDNGNSGVVVL